jgi:hypothetical protein
MPGFFEALDNFKNKKPKKHFVTVEGQTVEVSLEKKLEIQKTGRSMDHTKSSRWYSFC